MADITWVRFFSVSYRQKRDTVLIPDILSANFVRIEIEVFTPPKPPAWYRAGWLNQVYMVQGKPHLLPGQVVPLAPSIFRMPTDHPYRLRFSPVPYMPSAIVRFYRSV